MKAKIIFYDIITLLKIVIPETKILNLYKVISWTNQVDLFFFVKSSFL